MMRCSSQGSVVSDSPGGTGTPIIVGEGDIPR
jgi:hypothetical protein